MRFHKTFMLLWRKKRRLSFPHPYFTEKAGISNLTFPHQLCASANTTFMECGRFFCFFFVIIVAPLHTELLSLRLTGSCTSLEMSNISCTFSAVWLEPSQVVLFSYTSVSLFCLSQTNKAVVYLLWKCMTVVWLDCTYAGAYVSLHWWHIIKGMFFQIWPTHEFASINFKSILHGKLPIKLVLLNISFWIPISDYQLIRAQLFKTECS